MDFSNIRVCAFVGPSGTGKSYRAQMVAVENDIEFIIDDGLLIKGNAVIAGTSAKKAPTKVETVKHALFYEEDEKKEMQEAFIKYNPSAILILWIILNYCKEKNSFFQVENNKESESIKNIFI